MENAFGIKALYQAPFLNHIQKEEQQHGEQIYNYMAQNGMYN
jgi:ferritin